LIGFNSLVKTDDSITTISDVILLHIEQFIPSWLLRKRNAQLPGGQVDTGTCNGLWLVPHEDICSETVVHKVPGHLNKLIVLV